MHYFYSNSISLPAALHFHNELSTKGKLQLALYLVAGAHIAEKLYFSLSSAAQEMASNYCREGY